MINGENNRAAFFLTLATKSVLAAGGLLLSAGPNEAGCLGNFKVLPIDFATHR